MAAVSAILRTRSRSQLLPLFFTVFFGGVYASISLVNHYLFRTYALDLGLVTQAVWEYAHFRPAYSTLLLDSPVTNFLSCHFTLVPLLVSPLYWLFGHWTMLVVQILAVLAGGWGVYVYASARTQSKWLPLVLMLLLFSFCGIYSALAFDYHDNVVAAMLVPWLLHYFERERWLPALVLLALVAVSKENMALWAVFILLGLALRHFRNGALRNPALLLAALTFGYFLLVAKVWMPALDATHRDFAQLDRYRHLGQTFGEIVLQLLRHPGLLLEHLFLNTTGEAHYDYIKLELYLVLLLSGGWALLLRPWYLLMLVPILAQKLLTHDYALWGINYQYAVEFAPVLCLAVFEAVRMRKSERQQLWLAGTVAVLAGAATVFTMEKRQAKWYDAEATRFYSPAHYRSPYVASQLRSALRQIPEGAAVSAQTHLAPRLINRQKLYHYPVLQDAAYIAITKFDQNLYPLNPEQHQARIRELRQDLRFRVMYEDHQLLIFQRIEQAVK